MATIINNPGGGGDSGSSGMMVGMILVVLIGGILFFVYGLPALRGNGGNGEATDNGTTINIPDKVEVDVKSNDNY